MDRRALRVRLMQVFGVMLVASLALGAGVLAWLAVELHGLARDTTVSRQRLPAPVRRALPAERNILDHPQVTMVRYTSGVSKSAVVLFSTTPGQHLAGFLTLPPSVSVGGTPLSNLSTQAAIRAFARAGIRISHVALIRPQDVGEIVSTLGGITVVNHTDFTVAPGNGTEVRFPAATLRLNGRQAAMFVEAATTTERLETSSIDVLRGIVHAILEPSGVGHLESVGTTLSRSVSSDLSDADVLGLIDLRLQGGQVVECRAPRRQPLTFSSSQIAVERALGRGGAVGGPCHERRVSGQPAPPTVIVRAVQRYGWWLFGTGTAVMAALAAAAAALLAWRWPQRNQPPRGALPPLTWPPSSGD